MALLLSEEERTDGRVSAKPFLLVHRWQDRGRNETAEKPSVCKGLSGISVSPRDLDRHHFALERWFKKKIRSDKSLLLA